MTLPYSVFELVEESICDDNDEWSLNCDSCTNVGAFFGPIYKVVDQPEEEDWTFIDGKVCCDLCPKEVKS